MRILHTDQDILSTVEGKQQCKSVDMAVDKLKPLLARRNPVDGQAAVLLQLRRQAMLRLTTSYRTQRGLVARTACSVGFRTND